MNEKLNAIALKASEDLVALIRDAETKLLEAWNAAEEDAQANDTAPRFKIGFAITLDLDKDQMETVLSFGIKHKHSHLQSIPDPGQPELLPEGSVTISAEGTEPITMTNSQFSKAARILNKLKE